MDPKDYLMEELWPLLDDERRRELVDFAAWLAQYAPPPQDEDSEQNEDD